MFAWNHPINRRFYVDPNFCRTLSTARAKIFRVLLRDQFLHEEWAQKDKSLLSKVKSGLTTGYKNLKHGVQRKVSKIVTKEEQRSIGRGLQKVGVGTKKVITSKPVKAAGSALYKGLQAFGEGQRRQWEEPKKKTSIISKRVGLQSTKSTMSPLQKARHERSKRR